LDRQNHLISLVAVFLSLGIGILIGASMGVNALVLNQISVIEELQNEIQYFKEETKLYLEQVNRLNQEISNWRALEEEYFNPFFVKNKLAGHVVKVLCQGKLSRELKDFLELTGCRYQVFLFKENISWDELELALAKSEPEDPARFIAGLILNGQKTWPACLSEQQILTLYENSPPLFQEEQGENFHQELIFVAGTLDPFLSAIVENLFLEQKSVFFISSAEEDYQEVSGKNFQSGECRIDNLPGKLKLLELIQNM